MSSPKEKPRKGGNNQLWKDGYAEMAQKACQAGFTDKELGDLFGVAQRTIDRWKLQHEDFAAALKIGKEPADDRVERSLFHKAIGYQAKAVKIFPPRGEDNKPLLVEYVEQVPPDTIACIFWLKNRRPEKWRDKTEVDHSVNKEKRTLAEINQAIYDDAVLLGIIQPTEGPVGVAPPKSNGSGNGTTH
jgi:hypothetical protein